MKMVVLIPGPSSILYFWILKTIPLTPSRLSLVNAGTVLVFAMVSPGDFVLLKPVFGTGDNFILNGFGQFNEESAVTDYPND